ncbi:MaoC family dehydratase [Propionimicrobium sp. PCR01-08-3]|uniref:MaoC family dehydratase n=1 Tax=Propionimicrobium sp. PCR01-08-3 TaxID=3052086 RepID=UPI00255C6C1A|nr:MaoC family dehydratase [Propionimicrobium sp. PCR01-08-3]WIY81561.1 MaoC family dehydratase [Propionimicrobium sp. PCR01-08-3]
MSFTINDLTIGQSASFTKTVSETDVYLFAGISGDLNPAHVNQVASEQTQFKGRIAHGILGAAFISTVVGMYLPGPGTIYIGQELRFRRPIHIGDTVTATGTVTEINVEKNRAKLETTITNQDGVVVTTGVATVMPPTAE